MVKLKSCHPDKGGTREAFERVQHAYALLMAVEQPPAHPSKQPHTPPNTCALPVVPCGRAALLAMCEQEVENTLGNYPLDTLQALNSAVAALLRLRGVQQALGKDLDQRLGPVLASRAMIHTDPRLAQVDSEDAAACGVHVGQVCVQI